MTTAATIEDIILNRDRRGISVLREHLPPDYCTRAAKLVMKSRRGVHPTVLITTGFYILAGNAAETDGPPGALAIGKALRELGFEVVYVTDKYAVPFFTPDIAGQAKVLEFPTADAPMSCALAKTLLNELKPSLIISTERCGASSNGQYLNMYCRDIGEFTAKVDCLFDGSVPSIGIGDGGNEIGMGNLAAEIKKHPNLTPEPAVTHVNECIIASVSNWGAYGLIAALSIIIKRNLLPGVEWEKALITELARRGAVDGVSGVNKPLVDGFDLEENSATLMSLNEFLNERIQ